MNTLFRNTALAALLAFAPIGASFAASPEETSAAAGDTMGQPAAPMQKPGATTGAASEKCNVAFDQMDKNKDGYIEKRDATGELKKDWKAADANKQGKISLSEFSAFEAAHGEKDCNVSPSKGGSSSQGGAMNATPSSGGQKPGY